MQKTRASRGAKAGLELSAVAADTFEIAPNRSDFQKNHLCRRFGLTDAAARTIAELAFATRDDWRARA